MLAGPENKVMHCSFTIGGTRSIGACMNFFA